MIANVHDLVLTVGFMSLTHIDFDLTSIAALLTILGYSLNDTVVIYDRIREMLRRYKRMSMPDLLNASVNATLSRSIVTHVTVAMSLLGAAVVRRPGDPQLHRDHDVRRGAGRHLYVGVHRFADPDLSRRRRRPHGRAPKSPSRRLWHRPRHPLRRSPRRQRRGARGRAASRSMDRPHLPRQAPIDAHGGGGFRFAGMSHRGSLLCLPDGIWAWPIAVAVGSDRAGVGTGICPRRCLGFLHSRHRRCGRGSCRSRCGCGSATRISRSMP